MENANDRDAEGVASLPAAPRREAPAGAGPTEPSDAASDARRPMFPTRSPLDGSALTEVTATPASALDGVMTRAREAQRSWAEVAPRDRAVTLRALKRRILARAEEIAS